MDESNLFLNKIRTEGLAKARRTKDDLRKYSVSWMFDCEDADVLAAIAVGTSPVRNSGNGTWSMTSSSEDVKFVCTVASSAPAVSEYSSSSTYNVGDLVYRTVGGVRTDYVCWRPVTSPRTFSALFWKAITVDGGAMQTAPDAAYVRLSYSKHVSGMTYTYGTVIAKKSFADTGSSLQDTANLVTAWQGTPDDTHYPSEKLVKDSLDVKLTDPSGGSVGDVLKKTTSGVEWGTVDVEPSAYLKSASVSSDVLTLTKKDDTTMQFDMSGKMSAPTGGSAGDLLKKTASGTEWGLVDRVYSGNRLHYVTGATTIYSVIERNTVWKWTYGNPTTGETETADLTYSSGLTWTGGSHPLFGSVSLSFDDTYRRWKVDLGSTYGTRYDTSSYRYSGELSFSGPVGSFVHALAEGSTYTYDSGWDCFATRGDLDAKITMPSTYSNGQFLKIDSAGDVAWTTITPALIGAMPASGDIVYNGNFTMGSGKKLSIPFGSYLVTHCQIGHDYSDTVTGIGMRFLSNSATTGVPEVMFGRTGNGHLVGSSGYACSSLVPDDSRVLTATYASSLYTILGKTAADVDAKITAPSGGSVGDVLKKTASGVEWGAGSSGGEPASYLKSIADGTDKVTITKKDDTTYDITAAKVGAAPATHTHSDKLDSVGMASEYSATSAYAVGDFCTYESKPYMCNTAIASPGEAWTAAHWTLANLSSLFTSANTSNNAENVRTSATDATSIKTYIDNTVGNIETLLSDI